MAERGVQAATGMRVAIAQIAMHWTTAENVAAILRAIACAHRHGARICAFSELAVTGFHRQIAREAQPESVAAALREIAAAAARCGIAVAVGAPTFGDADLRYISQILIDERGQATAAVAKRGLTDPEATVFARGTARPVGLMHGLRSSAVICREVEDFDLLTADLPAGSVDLIFVPGALRQDPEKPRTDPPQYVRDIQRLARATGAYAVQTNWPNALNRPEESSELGGSTVAAPDGEVLLRLPMREFGVGIVTLGERVFDWVPE